MEYTAGLLFNGDKVALILKQEPEWQRGKLNGIGGKCGFGEGIDPNESPEDCIIREFEEEAGPKITNWRKFCIMKGTDWTVHWFMTRGNYSLKKGHYPASSATGEFERILWIPIDDLPYWNIMSNLRWLIPLALDKDNVTAEISDPINQ